MEPKDQGGKGRYRLYHIVKGGKDQGKGNEERRGEEHLAGRRRERRKWKTCWKAAGLEWSKEAGVRVRGRPGT